MSTPPPPQTSLQKPTLPIHTLHCTFCSHLLLATTRSLRTLPCRQPPAADNALILPLEKLRSHSSGPDTSTSSSSESQSNHVTLLLSTTLPDKRATLIRREDGIEKRVLLRCGRCRVVVGYYLDAVHWKADQDNGVEGGRAGEDEEEDRAEKQFPAIYVLPGALVETEGMGKEGLGEEEWRRWVGDS